MKNNKTKLMNKAVAKTIAVRDTVTSEFYDDIIGNEVEVKVNRKTKSFSIYGNDFVFGKLLKHDGYNGINFWTCSVVDYETGEAIALVTKWDGDAEWSATDPDLSGEITREHENMLDAAIQYIIEVF
jgi:hypothetical protein